MRIGVLALQGAFIEHCRTLRALGVETTEVRLPEQLDGIQALVIPGGESTTIGKLLVTYELRDPLSRLIRGGLPVFGTCAGLIVLATEVVGHNQPLIGAIDITVNRNAFGSQVDSFETDLAVPALGEAPFRAVFIRAPAITRVGPGVEVLATLPSGPIVAARQGAVVVSAFHPELTGDRRFHQYFLSIVRESRTGLS
ncbi:MAG: pyridoxal 5'-phosphate synthase glutaminase subunit PdxT [Chloroflexota bacterium]